jgi:hypothetical protein
VREIEKKRGQKVCVCVCVRGGEEKLEERKKKSVNPKQTTGG